MDTKICKNCGLEKPLIEFNFRDKRRGTYRAQCKECLHKRKNELYLLNYRERYKDKIKENKKRHREYIRELIISLKSKGCCICGEKDTCCLDFHHLYNKEFTISSNPDISEKNLLNEIDKCVVLCANCHRKIHAGKIKNTVFKIKTRTMILKIKRLTDDAIIPIRTHEGDAGIDLTCTTITQELNECGQLILVYHTGLAVEIPEGYVGLLFQRSSVAKKSLTMTNAVGVIDSGYRGEIMGKFRSTTDVVPAIYKPGERFAQLVIVPYVSVQIEECAELSNTDRGEGGYGSTGDISAVQEEQSSLETETAVTNSDNEQAAEQMSSEQV